MKNENEIVVLNENEIEVVSGGNPLSLVRIGAAVATAAYEAGKAAGKALYEATH